MVISRSDVLIRGKIILFDSVTTLMDGANSQEFANCSSIVISTGDRWCVFSLSSLECTLIFINGKEHAGMVRERSLYPLISHGKFSLMEVMTGSFREDDDEGGSFDGRNSLTFVEPMTNSSLPKSMMAPIL